MPESQNKLSIDRLGQLIYEIRGQRVMLDSDLANTYGVKTKALNQAVRRNRDRFPKDFMFTLTRSETVTIRRSRSQFVTLKRGENIKYLPHAFTEHGAIMAANVLNSRRAVQMSVFVIRAFVKMREQIAANAAILKRLAEIDNTLLLHDAALRDVYKKLLPLLAPPSQPRKRIGFHS
jgi:hypothetical protein